MKFLKLAGYTGLGALAADFSIGTYIFNTTVVRKNTSFNRTTKLTGVQWEKYDKERKEIFEKLNSSESKHIYTKSYDNLKLHGQYFKGWYDNEPDIKRVAICFHGYTSQGIGNNSAAAMFFLNNGFDVLFPDARAHGESEGKYIGFGCLDRFDGLEWVRVIQRMHKEAENAGKLEIYLYGVSMGGATVCMMSGLDLPDCVKGIISDCAFTSAEYVFKTVIKNKYNLPIPPVLFATNIICKNVAGYGLNECNSAAEVKKAKVPMLFIHGSADGFIPVKMCHEIYDSCASKKDIMIVEGAVHVESYYKAREAYEEKIKEFFNI
ncbi:MAG TPA: alpha/beta hydrolase [Candidatus Monoglobus merdigallinarum]|uniref:Alpha/beta hydrolase n=1 Tax=Candidatus Monoglobus merdigallinarum TaxID=2838698 RepID=A0A9D1TMP1_9FIRM|nr:alpha/beta hydrolase [Candidatus Monoglobus merdigallinarum]